jgi:hypothetical protein
MFFKYLSLEKILSCPILKLNELKIPVKYWESLK